MKIQAYMTAAAINLKRLAVALLAILWAIWTDQGSGKALLRAHRSHTVRAGLRPADAT